MARPLRIQYAGAFYHVTGKGSDRKKIFQGEADFEKFKECLQEAKEKFHAIVHCYVLMGNHYHLILETPDANLSRIMHSVIGSYTIYFNKKRKRTGQLFQDRYKAILIDKDSYLLELSRYLHLNPVRARLVRKPEAYSYSSYRAYILKEKDGFVSPDLVLKMISSDRNRAPQKYRAFVESGITKKLENPIEKVYRSAIAGSTAFIQAVRRRVAKKAAHPKNVSQDRRPQRSGLDDVMAVLSSSLALPRKALLKSGGTTRNIAIFFLKKYTGLTNPEIGALFGGLTYSAVTKVCKRLDQAASTDPRLMRQITRIERAISRIRTPNPPA
jgi:putative transposase